jgi:HAD superfamily hydrolase (TIGR01662 family)
MVAMKSTSQGPKAKNNSTTNEQVIFFDLGDTLIYFDGDWSKVLQRSTKNLWKSLAAAGYPLDREQFSQDFTSRMRNYYAERKKNLIEKTTAKILIDFLSDLGFAEPDDNTIKIALNAMYAVSQENWNLEADTLPIIDWLQKQRFRIGLISNASDLEDVCSLLSKFDLTNYFEHTIISAEFGLRKPHQGVFKEALQLFQAEPQNCFMVGDRLDMDILGANQMGITSIWITRRSKHKGIEHQFNVRPDYQISSLLEIKEILTPRLAV